MTKPDKRVATQTDPLPALRGSVWQPDPMPDYTILHQFSPEASDVPLFCQPGFFFNEIEHLRQQKNGAFHLLTVLNQQTGLQLARFVG